MMIVQAKSQEKKEEDEKKGNRIKKNKGKKEL